MPNLWSECSPRLRGKCAPVLLPVSVLLACSLTACADLQKKMTSTGSADNSQEARLQALEAGMLQLTKRLEAMQASMASAYSVARPAAAEPAENRPVRPAVVLASSPVRQLPVTAPPPARAHEPVPAIVPPAPAEKEPVTPKSRPRQGDWVINLASYKNKSYATRKQAEFAGKGVVVEQVRAEVNGKTIYRLCVPGFGSSRAANAEAAVIRNKLGLGDTWIARHQ